MSSQLFKCQGEIGLEVGSENNPRHLRKTVKTVISITFQK